MIVSLRRLPYWRLSFGLASRHLFLIGARVFSMIVSSAAGGSSPSVASTLVTAATHMLHTVVFTRYGSPSRR